jgi:peptidyl-prolyl cis-trans isomerase B (cyclophilin B)
VSKRLFIVIAALAIAATACGGSSKDKVDAESTPTTNATDSTAAGTTPGSDPTSTSGLPTVKLATSEGDIVLEMDTKNAPKAAGRFIKLVKDGFYDGLTFHRVVPNFVIQGGDPEGTGAGGTKESVVGETPTDGYPIGSLAAAKTQADPAGTFDCQFFIITGEDGETLPPEYARFGKVISGIEVAKKIEALSPGGDGAPTKKVTIDKATVSGE